MLDILIARAATGQQTVLYVQDMGVLGKHFGKDCRELLEDRYIAVGV